MGELTVVLRAKDMASRVLTRVSGAVRKFGSGVGRVFRAIGRQFSLLRSAMVGALGIGAVKMFADFEEGMAAVSTLVNTATVDMEALSRGVLQVGETAGDSLKSLTKSLFDAVSAGIEGAKAIEFLEQASKLAAGGVTTTAQATKGLVSILNAYGLSAEKAADVSDSLFQAQKFGITTIGALSENVGKVAPIARQAGLSIDEMTGTIAALTKSGLSTEEAVTALRNVLVSLVKPSKESLQAAKELGIQWDVAKLQAEGLSGVFAQLSGRTFSVQQQMALANNNIRSFVGVSSLAADDARVLRDILSGMAEKAGSTEEAFVKMSQTLKFQFAAAFNAVRTGIIEIVQQLKPDIASLADGIRAFGDTLKANASIIAAWIRLAINLFKVFFAFVQGRFRRYAEDQRKIWSDLAKVVEAFARVAGRIVLAFVKMSIIAFREGGLAIVEELSNIFKGFSLIDLVMKGDAFAERKSLVRAARHARELVEIRRRALEESEKHLSRLRKLASEGVPISFVDLKGAWNQIREVERLLEDAIQQEASVLQRLGLMTQEQFGTFLRQRMSQALQDMVGETGEAAKDVGQILGDTLRGIGAEDTLSQIREALRRFRRDLEGAEPIDFLGGILGGFGAGAERSLGAIGAVFRNIRSGLSGLADALSFEGEAAGEAAGRAVARGLSGTGELVRRVFRGLMALDPELVSEIRDRILGLQDELRSLSVDQTRRQIEEINIQYEREVGFFRVALEKKKILQADFDRFMQLAAEVRTKRIAEIEEQLAQVRTDKLNEWQQLGSSVASILAQNFSQLFRNLAEGTQSAGEAFKQFVTSILSMLAELALQIALTKLLKSIGLSAAAQGAVFPGGFRPIERFQGGGLVTRPTLGIVGEGRMNEAVVPLPNGRSIPVEFQGRNGGGTAASISVTFNVSAMDGQDVMRVLTRNARAVQAAVLGRLNVDADFARAVRQGGVREPGRRLS